MLYARNERTASELEKRGYRRVSVKEMDFDEHGRCLYDFKAETKYAILVAGEQVKRAEQKALTSPIAEPAVLLSLLTQLAVIPTYSFSELRGIFGKIVHPSQGSTLLHFRGAHSQRRRFQPAQLVDSRESTVTFQVKNFFYVRTRE